MNKSETIAYNELKNQGYLVEKPVNKLIKTKTGYISLHHDLWGVWDFCAVNKKHIRFIQVSSKYFTQRSRADQQLMKEFPQPPNTKKEYWRWDKKKRQFIKEEL